MKRLIFSITIILLFYPEVSFSAIIIYLKNGRQIEADGYYQEGKQIKYRLKDGEFGIDKDEVLEIKKISEKIPEKGSKEIEETSLPETPVPQAPSPEIPEQIPEKESLKNLIEMKRGTLKAIDQRIDEIEKRLEFIQDKEKEQEAITRELDRPKYKELVRKKRELKTKKLEVETELEDLREEKDSLIKEIDELRTKKRVVENELSDLEYEERYGTPPSIPSSQ